MIEIKPEDFEALKMGKKAARAHYEIIQEYTQYELDNPDKVKNTLKEIHGDDYHPNLLEERLKKNREVIETPFSQQWIDEQNNWLNSK